MGEPRSQRLNGWAIETALDGQIDARSVADAAAQLRMAGGARVWLLDGSSVQGLDLALLDAVRSEFATLRTHLGLEYVALVVPAAAVAAVGMMVVVPDPRMPRVRVFATRTEGLAWIRNRCR